MTKRFILDEKSKVKRKLIFDYPIPVFNPLKVDLDDDEDEIKFYQKNKPYFEFSNFYHDKKNPIIIDGRSYKTAENAFQAYKFDEGSEYFEIIRNADTANQARLLGNQKCKGGYPSVTKMNSTIQKYQNVIKMKENWNEIRDDIMQMIVDAKFSQNTRLKQLLLDTGNKRIKEDTKDAHWGGEGDNALGLILERTREKLRKGEL